MPTNRSFIWSGREKKNAEKVFSKTHVELSTAHHVSGQAKNDGKWLRICVENTVRMWHIKCLKFHGMERINVKRARVGARKETPSACSCFWFVALKCYKTLESFLCPNKSNKSVVSNRRTERTVSNSWHSGSGPWQEEYIIHYLMKFSTAFIQYPTLSSPMFVK